METAVCVNCIDDEHVAKHVRMEGSFAECSICHGDEAKVFTVEQLCELIDPLIRKNFGQDEEGEPLSSVVQEMLGQCFDFEEEIIAELVRIDPCDPRDGDEPFYDDTATYSEIRRRFSITHYYAQWDMLLEELKHKRRFFSSSAKSMFSKIFDDVETLKSRDPDRNAWECVVCELPVGTRLFRARVCDSSATLQLMFRAPFQQVGPVPSSRARAGRMNAEGVTVLYCGRDADTCLAELRPALGVDAAVIELSVKRPLRLLDFSRLERSYSGAKLSYFQPDFAEVVERGLFLRKLHNLISQPVTPGNEADYVITQTMAEYLAHVHKPPFDGVLFKSVQRAEGVNVALFANPRFQEVAPIELFPVEYVDRSLTIHTTNSINYGHSKREFFISGDAVSLRRDGDFEYEEDDR